VVGQESQILPAFIIGLDKAQSFNAWTQWTESLSQAEHLASQSLSVDETQVLLDGVRIDGENSAVLHGERFRQGDRGPNSLRSPRNFHSNPRNNALSPRRDGGGEWLGGGGGDDVVVALSTDNDLNYELMEM
jgi:hypothetical protein